MNNKMVWAHVSSVPLAIGSHQAIRYKSSQSSAIAPLYCGLFTSILHAKIDANLQLIMIHQHFFIDFIG